MTVKFNIHPDATYMLSQPQRALKTNHPPNPYEPDWLKREKDMAAGRQRVEQMKSSEFESQARRMKD
jgi:hypothetical protein